MAKKKPQITSKKSKRVKEPAGVDQVAPAGVDQVAPAGVDQVEPAGVDQVEPITVGLIPQADYGISTWIRERDERRRRVIEERLARAKA